MNPASRTDASSPPRRWRCQFRVRTLLLFVSGVALLLGFIVPYLQKREERRLVAELRAAGNFVFYDYEWDEAGAHGVKDASPTGPAWIRRIAGNDLFAHPTSVGFSSDPGARDKPLPTFGQLTSLTSVDVDNCSAASEPFKAVSSLSRLRRLVVGGPIDFHDLGQIPPMPSVAKLELRCQCYCLTDSVCALIVQKFPGLSDLELEGRAQMGGDGSPQLTDKGLSVFRRLPHLTRFSVMFCPNVSPAGIADFSGSPDLKELRAHIGLDPHATDVTVPRVRIHDYLNDLQRRTSPFWVNSITTCRWRLFLERVPQIKELRIENVRELAIDDPSGIKKLVLGNDCDISAADFSKIAACACLVEVELVGFEGDLGSALKDLGKIPSLRRLVVSSSLNEPRLKRIGYFEQIGCFKQLQALDISNNHAVDDRCLQKLEQLGNLRSLRLFGTGVSSEGIRRIKEAIPGLRCDTRPQGAVSMPSF